MGVYKKDNRWYIDYYVNSKRKREVVGHVDKITWSLADKALKARRGEILNLKWEDVDLKKDYIYVKETKNNETRAIPIPGILKETLIEINDPKNNYVFQTFKDKSLQSFYREFWNARKVAGVDSTFHILRHTFASNLVTRLKKIW